MNPCGFRVLAYRSYHKNMDSIQPYIAFNRPMYITFRKFSIHTFYLYSRFTYHMMSTNSPSIFNMMNLSSGMSELRYAPGTSKMATYISVCASMIRLVNRASKDMACEDASYLGMQYLYVLPSANVFPFSFPHFFFFIRFIDLSDPFSLTL